MFCWQLCNFNSFISTSVREQSRESQGLVMLWHATFHTGDEIANSAWSSLPRYFVLTLGVVYTLLLQADGDSISVTCYGFSFHNKSCCRNSFRLEGTSGGLKSNLLLQASSALNSGVMTLSSFILKTSKESIPQPLCTTYCRALLSSEWKHTPLCEAGTSPFQFVTLISPDVFSAADLGRHQLYVGLGEIRIRQFRVESYECSAAQGSSWSSESRACDLHR